jgi:hypothetical protein
MLIEHDILMLTFNLFEDCNHRELVNKIVCISQIEAAWNQMLT